MNNASAVTSINRYFRHLQTPEVGGNSRAHRQSLFALSECLGGAAGRVWGPTWAALPAARVSAPPRAFRGHVWPPGGQLWCGGGRPRRGCRPTRSECKERCE